MREVLAMAPPTLHPAPIHDFDWLERFSNTLIARWPHVPPTYIDDVALDLIESNHWRAMAPEAAAELWSGLQSSAAA